MYKMYLGVLLKTCSNSADMLGLVNSLENWYYRILVLLTGNLPDSQVAVDSLSIW